MGGNFVAATAFGEYRPLLVLEGELLAAKKSPKLTTQEKIHLSTTIRSNHYAAKVANGKKKTVATHLREIMNFMSRKGRPVRLGDAIELYRMIKTKILAPHANPRWPSQNPTAEPGLSGDLEAEL